MAITKRPKAGEGVAAGTELDELERERREQKFLSGAPDVARTPRPEDTKMQTVHLRFEPEMLPVSMRPAKNFGPREQGGMGALRRHADSSQSSKVVPMRHRYGTVTELKECHIGIAMGPPRNVRTTYPLETSC